MPNGPIQPLPSLLVRNLPEDDLLHPVHAELGVWTEVHGRIKLASGEAVPPLALMGRLAKGSIIGADSLIEGFGPQRAASSSRNAFEPSGQGGHLYGFGHGIGVGAGEEGGGVPRARPG